MQYCISGLNARIHIVDILSVLFSLSSLLKTMHFPISLAMVCPHGFLAPLVLDVDCFRVPQP